MPKSEKVDNSIKYLGNLPKVNQVIYTLEQSVSQIMILAQAVLEIFRSQGSIGLQWESRKKKKKGRNSATTSPTEKNLSLTVLCRMQSVTHHTPRTDRPKPICPHNFFEVWGIMTLVQEDNI